MKTCPACGCPASTIRSICAWCESPLTHSAPVAFTLEQAGDGFEWLADGAMVAAAVPVHGVWQIHDAHRRHIVTLMPLSQVAGDERPALALVGPSARLLGTIHRDDDARGRADATTCDEAGEVVLVLRGDGPTGSHIVDRGGDVVAVSSWGDRLGITDILVTANGARQSLAMVFGLVLATELARQAPDRLG